MARIGLASLVSLVLTGWFLVVETESPGMSFAVALLGMPLFLTLFGFFKIQSGALPADARNAGWAALVIAALGCGYILVFFTSWLPVLVGWVFLNIPLIAVLIASPATSNGD